MTGWSSDAEMRALWMRVVDDDPESRAEVRRSTSFDIRARLARRITYAAATAIAM